MECPVCKQSTAVIRVPRSWWVKLLLPSSRRYLCRACERPFLRWSRVTLKGGHSLE